MTSTSIITDDPPTRRRRSLRAGFTLIEVTLALVIGFVFSALMLRLINDVRDTQNARAMAIRLSDVSSAANQYISIHRTALYTAAAGGPLYIPAGQTVSGGAQPAASSGFNTLQTEGLLPANFVDTNFFGQNTVLIVRQGAGANGLEGVVLTVNGRAAPDKITGQAVNFLGADGGEIPATATNNVAGAINGYHGGWVVTAANFTAGGYTPTAGHVAYYTVGNNQQVIGDYLWRTNIGIPEANRLHTDVDVGKHNLDHIQQLSGGAPTNPDAVGTGGLDGSPSAASATDTAIHLANSLVPAVGYTVNTKTDGSDVTPSDYTDSNGNKYPYYVNPAGLNRTKYLDPSTIINWDAQGGTNPKNYPTGTRLIDALPNVVVYASYLANNGDIIPMPPCGNAANPVYGAPYAKIFAMPVDSFDHLEPNATTASTANYTQVPVVSDAYLSSVANSNQIVLNKTTTTVNSIAATNGVTSTTTVTSTGVASNVYAVAGGAGNTQYWVFNYIRKTGDYKPGAETAFTTETYDPYYKSAYNYRNSALVQTACYYGP